VLSGGMESMTNAPYLLAKARGGYRVGHDRIIDHMLMDGLEDAYETGRSMGGALCIIASLITLAISRQPKLVMA
jgi:acetyl-CoA acetyltransferase